MTIESFLTGIGIYDIIIVAITLIATFIIIRWVSYFLKKTGARLEIDVTLIQVLREILKYTIIAISLTIILKQLGIDVTAIAVSFGIVGIALGFAARDTVSNFISGVFVIADKSFRVGDIIEVSNKKGKVIRMGLRLTTIQTYDKKIITVPNSLFSSNPYINYTASDLRRVDLDITIPYELEIEKTLKSLEDVASKCEWVLKKPKPKVIIKELSDAGVKLMLCIWINDPWGVAESKSLLAKEVNKILISENA
jgi:small conductance mechanosensitive channel